MSVFLFLLQLQRWPAKRQKYFASCSGADARRTEGSNSSDANNQEQENNALLHPVRACFPCSSHHLTQGQFALVLGKRKIK
jgi:hypothetical protein